MGRCQSMEDFSIVGEFDVTQIYCSKDAYDAAMELNERALKLEESDKEFFKNASCIIGFLNVESLRAHQVHLRKEQEFLQSDIFVAAETWLYPGEKIEIPSHASHLLSNGRGKGLASFTKGHSKMIETIEKDEYSMMKMELDKKFFIFMYISKNAKSSEYIHDIDALLKNTSNSPTALIGDVNWNYAQKSHPMKKFMQDNKFEQIIEKPTHIGGNIIDHVYVNPKMKDLSVQILQKPVPFSDHYALYLKINK